MAQDAAGAEHECHVREWAWTLRGMGWSSMATGRDDGGSGRELLLGGPLVLVSREVRRVGRDGHGIRDGLVRQRNALLCCGVDDAFGVPAHAEVGFDGARVPELADDVAADRRILTARRHD